MRALQRTALLLALAAAAAAVAAARPADSSAQQHTLAAAEDSRGDNIGSGPLLSGSGGSGGGSSMETAAAVAGTLPEGIRLAFGDGEDEMAVTWSTRLEAGQPCVQHQLAAGAAGAAAGTMQLGGGQEGGSSSSEGELEAASLPAGDGDVQTACGASEPFLEPATGAVSQQLHRVVLRKLPPGQAVRYRCGSAAGGWSEWRAFRAKRSPEQVSPDAPVRLLLVGDMGLYNARCWPDMQAEALGQPAGQPAGRQAAAAAGGRKPAAAGADLGDAQEQVARTAGAGDAAAEREGQRAAAGGGRAALGCSPGSSGAAGGQGEQQGSPYDALLHVGDLAYDLAALAGRRASLFLRKVEPAASRLPYMVVPGNHEWHSNFSHYRSLFSMPGRQRGANLYYSFDLGPLHVLVYNTEVFFWPDLFGEAEMRAQHEWMEADLKAANANRRRTPWVLVVGHRPMYCVQAQADGRCNEEHEASRLGVPSFCPHNNPVACRPLRPAGAGPTFPIEELFLRYGVDLAVFGHIHDYERFFPVANHSVPGTPANHSTPSAALSLDRYVDPRATVHVTTGAGGNSEMHVGPEPPPQGPCADSAPWCAFQSGFGPAPGQSYDFSYSRVEVFNATHLRWQQYSSLLGRVVDEWWVVQSAHGPFAPAAGGA